MNKTLRKVLIERFESGLPDAGPGFARATRSSDRLTGGDVAYTRSVDGLNVFLVLTMNPSGGDEFTLEAGWSTSHSFPAVKRGRLKPSAERTELGADDFLFRLPRLATGKDTWYRVREAEKSQDPISAARAKRLLDPHVAAALDLVKRHAEPYFAELIAARAKKG